MPLVYEFSTDLDAALLNGDLSESAWTRLKLTTSSLLINLGATVGDRSAIEAGVAAAQDAIDRPAEPALLEQFVFNVANGMSNLHIVHARGWRASDPNVPPGLLALRDRELLRLALTEPDVLLKPFTKNVLGTALNEELTAQLCHEKIGV